MNKKLIIILSVVALVVAAVLALVLSASNGPAASGSSAAESSVAASRKRPIEIAQPKRGKSSSDSRLSTAKKPKPVIEVDDDDDNEPDENGMVKTPAEKDLLKRIEKSLEDEILADAVACAAEAQKCRIVEIRQAMVDTLGWFGEKALPELTPFLVDPDEDVRDSANSEWSMAVSAIEDEAEKLGTVELAMSVLSDEDVLEDISGEYIGTDEKLAVESLTRVIVGGSSSAKGIEKAKETYEFVTGEEWAGVEAAEKWIREEYHPDDE